MKKFFASVSAWANKNASSIYTGCFVTLIMMTIMFVKDMKHTSREIDHLMDRIELTRENNELVQGSIEQFQMINDLMKTSNQQHNQLDQAVETINEQTTILQKLVDYLKKIGHWPPKIDPPKPVDPDSLARGRSEA